MSEHLHKIEDLEPCAASIGAIVAVFFVRVYQCLLSPLKMFFFGTSCSCRFQPTCSCFASTALLRFGLLRGSYLILCRILRCNPWNSGGYDPVPSLKNNKVKGISKHLINN